MANIDRTIVAVLRGAGVLVDFVLEEHEGGDGQVVCMCSDGDQMVDAVVQMIRVTMDGDTRVRPHVIAVHGGAMGMSGRTGLYDDHRIGDLQLTHIEQAEGPDLKGIDTAHLSIHVPCGAAGMVGMTVVHQIWHLVAAARRVQDIDPDNAVLNTLHVDYGEDPERVALVSSDKMWVFQQLVDAFIEQAKVNYGPVLAATLLRLPLDTHRRRTYRIDLDAFVAFWHEQGREIWGNLFDEDPCPPKRRAINGTPEVPIEDLGPARELPTPRPGANV
jgi:hypothetical protein